MPLSISGGAQIDHNDLAVVQDSQNTQEDKAQLMILQVGTGRLLTLSHPITSSLCSVLLSTAVRKVWQFECFSSGQ